MKRLMSHMLLFALLVVSPLSFTTSEIPSIFISVTIIAPLQESRKNTISVAHRVGKSLEPAVVVLTPSQRIVLLPTLAAIDNNRDIEHGRAPPVVPSA